ncbi:hypothetical protein [Microbacterium sp. LWO13-1.2]|uniref:hypothetical protein n=1 Tax=Microbacterium sp. LWO13-1.2 TaxID=3135262 RepID=UPI00313900A1
MTHPPQDWTSKDVVTGVNSLRGKRRGGLRVTDDINDTDFRINTNEALRFLADHVGNLLDRIEVLETELRERDARGEA